jgi:predicted glycosyl hydrolase (DUF1957 family)
VRYNGRPAYRERYDYRITGTAENRITGTSPESRGALR